MTKLFQIFVVGLCFFAAAAQAGENTPLHDAAKEGNKAKVEALLAKGAEVNAKDKGGWTPLHSAAYYGKKDVAEFLLAKGADVNARDNDGTTPLHSAMHALNIDMVELLVAKGASFNTQDNIGTTPLAERVDVTNVPHAVDFSENLFLKQSKAPRELFGQLTRQLNDQDYNRPRSLVLPIPDNGPSQGSGLQLPTPNFRRNFAIRQNDISTRRLIIKLATMLKPALAVPEEARKHFVEGTAIVKAAKNPAQQATAAQSFIESLKVAPWWGDAYYNLGVAQELAEKYDEAEQAFNFYLASNPGEKEAREVQDRIYALSAKRKLSGGK